MRRWPTFRRSLTTGTIACVAAGALYAQIHVIPVSLDSLQVGPPIVSAGTGTGTVTLDDVTGAVSVTGTYTGFTGTQTLVHIHGPAPPGVNAGVVVTLTGTGGTSGTYSGAGVLSAPQITDMLNGQHYLNVHSTAFPGGEVRGQVVLPPPPIPVLPPWGFALLGLVLLGAGAWMIARRSAATSTC